MITIETIGTFFETNRTMNGRILRQKGDESTEKTVIRCPLGDGKPDMLR